MNLVFFPGLAIAVGIFAYGVTYFIVHDIFIHQRFKFLRKANNWYAKGVRKAHKMHHANIKKNGGERNLGSLGYLSRGNKRAPRSFKSSANAP